MTMPLERACYKFFSRQKLFIGNYADTWFGTTEIQLSKVN